MVITRNWTFPPRLSYCKSIGIYRNTVTIVLDTDTVTNWDRSCWPIWVQHTSYVHCNNNDINFFVFAHCSRASHQFFMFCFSLFFYFDVVDVIYWVSRIYWICYIILFSIVINENFTFFIGIQHANHIIWLIEWCSELVSNAWLLWFCEQNLLHF